jgi:hypothetical protein
VKATVGFRRRDASFTHHRIRERDRKILKLAGRRCVEWILQQVFYNMDRMLTADVLCRSCSRLVGFIYTKE